MPAPGIEQLRDIHPPPLMAAWEALGAWSPLLLAGLAAAGVAWWLLRRHRCRPSVVARRLTLAQLRAAQERHARDGDAVRYARELDALLRREALRRYPDANLRRLTGDDWLAFLDRTGGTDAFFCGPGRCLATLPYQRDGRLESAAVAALVARWLAH